MIIRLHQNTKPESTKPKSANRLKKSLNCLTVQKTGNMKKIISILLMAFTLSSTAKPKPLCIGYEIVTYETGKGYEKHNTIELVDIYTIADMIGSFDIDFEKELKKNVAIEFSKTGNMTKRLYIEVKKITFSGKYKRLNKAEIKQYLQRWQISQ